MGSRVWPFGVTWRHRSRDHSTPGDRLLMGGLSISLSISKTFALKLKNFLNHAEFCTFFALLNFKVAVPLSPKNLYPIYHAWTAARHVVKFRWATPPNSEIISRPLLHLSQFLTPFKKNCKGDPVSGGGALARLGHSLARVKIWGLSTY